MDIEDTIDFLNKTANHMDAIGEHSYYSDGLKETIKVIQELQQTLSKKSNEHLDTRIQDCMRIALLQAKLDASYTLY